MALTLALLMSGCPSDDAPADTDTDTDTDTDGTTTSSTNPTDATNPTATDDTSPTSTDDTGTTTTTGPLDTGTDDTTTGPPPPEGVCLGLDLVGNINTVFSMGGPPPGPCDPTPAPCGGDVVGTWDVESACGYDSVPNPLEDDCPGSTFSFNVVGQAGSATFEADGTFTRDFNVQLEAVFDLDPMACFGVDCATFEGILQMDDPSASCVDAMGTCTCTFPPPPPPPPSMGTYQVNGDQLVLDVDGEITELDFCVNGGRFDTWEPVLDVTFTEEMCDDDQECIDALGDMHDAYFCLPPEEM